MENVIYIIQYDVVVHKNLHTGEVINQFFPGQNLKYYKSRDKAVNELHKLIEKIKSWLIEDNLEIDSIRHENVNSDIECYLIKVKNINRPIYVTIMPLELGE